MSPVIHEEQRITERQRRITLVREFPEFLKFEDKCLIQCNHCEYLKEKLFCKKNAFDLYNADGQCPCYIQNKQEREQRIGDRQIN